jgi:hypothetical protein
MNSAIVHAGISRSAHYLKLSDRAALLAVLMLAHCDDYGRILADSDHIALNVCPSRWPLKDVEEILTEIENCRDKKGESMLTRYEVDGQGYFYYTNWFKYQRISGNYTARSVCPHPLLGLREPNVLGVVLSRFFHKWMGRAEGEKRPDGSELQEYNRDAEAVSAFLARDPGDFARDSGRSARDPRGNGPSPSPAPSPASDPSPASARAKRAASSGKRSNAPREEEIDHVPATSSSVAEVRAAARMRMGIS